MVRLVVGERGKYPTSGPPTMIQYKLSDKQTNEQNNKQISDRN